MSRKSQTLEKPQPVLTSAPAKPVELVETGKRSAWKFNMRGIWINPIVIIENVATEAEARAAIHQLLDQAITKIERTR